MVMFSTAVSGCFAIAFLSYYIQFPGLFGAEGLLPVEEKQRTRSYMEFPTLAHASMPPPFTVEATLEGFCILGFLMSVMNTFPFFNFPPFSIMRVLIYLTLFLTGQRFMSFQWDILLIEVGFIALLFHHPVKDASLGPANWVARGMYVKFLMMTMYVKSTAGCSTWSNLTAGEYHMASQCLPTPSAWMFHQLPPFVSRLSIAIMFFVQGPALLLLLAPIREFREVGAALQFILQALIAVTGNYNWFNLLTVALLIPCVASDMAPANLYPFFTDQERRQYRAAKHYRSMLRGLAIAMVLGVFSQMYSVEYQTCDTSGAPYWIPPSLWGDCWKIKPLYDVKDVVKYTQMYLNYGPMIQIFLMACSIVSSVQDKATLLPCMGIFMHGVACLFFLLIGFLPWDHVVRGGAQFPGKKMIQDVHAPFEGFHATSSYGLFRVMTGVGKDLDAKWGGLPIPNVEVPAVILEGYDGKKWLEIPFRYAPGREEKMPVQTAPHQPRLDWQMWFAALGNYQHNDWLVHLIYKLLLGSPRHDKVLELLDHPNYPFPKKPPVKMRGWLYHYDFTRLKTPWNAFHHNNSLVSMDSKRWWHRTRVREYLPEVDLAMLGPLAKEQKWDKKPRERTELGKSWERLRSNVLPSSTGFWLGSYFVDTPFLVCVSATFKVIIDIVRQEN